MSRVMMIMRVKTMVKKKRVMKRKKKKRKKKRTMRRMERMYHQRIQVKMLMRVNLSILCMWNL